MATLVGFSLATLIISCIAGSLLVRGAPQLHPRRNAKSGRMFSMGETCWTETCQNTARTMKTSQNTSADPCQDFYEYACGGYIAAHPIPPDVSRVGNFDDLIDKVQLLRQALLSSPQNATFESEDKIKSYYRQCVDDELRAQLKGIPVLDHVQTVVGVWPILNPAWNASNFNLLQTLLTDRKFGHDTLLGFSASPSLLDPTHNIPTFYEPETFATKDLLLSADSDTYTDSYANLIIDVMTLLMADSGANVSLDSVLKDVVEIVDLEVELTLSKLTAVESRNLTLYKVTTLALMASEIFFRSEFSNHLVQYVVGSFASAGLGNSIRTMTEVAITSIEYYLNLDQILLDVESLGGVGQRRLANYIGWKIVHACLPYLSDEYRRAGKRHKNRIYFVLKKRNEPLSGQCVDDAITFLPLAVGVMYVREDVPKDLREKGMIMAANIFEGFRQSLLTADWIDEDSRAFALVKLNATIRMVTFPEIFTDNLEAIDTFYNPYSVQSYYFETRLQFLSASTHVNLKSFTKVNKRGDPFVDGFDVTTVNAYYSPTSNLIAILAAIMREPFFDPKNPQYINFGGLGMIMGHEITHGFDDQGSQSDELGRLRSWWQPKTYQKFLDKALGFVFQYSNYSFPTGYVNGILTLGENIADNGGLKASFRGYKLYQSKLDDPEDRLPGFEGITFEQMFFLAYGQVWCGATSRQFEQYLLLVDPHSPGRARVNGVVVNMPEFAQAFHCANGTKMNPVSKNAIW